MTSFDYGGYLQFGYVLFGDVVLRGVQELQRGLLIDENGLWHLEFEVSLIEICLQQAGVQIGVVISLYFG